MSYLNFKSEEEKAKIKADAPKTLHKVVSIIYIGFIVLSSPLILIASVYGAFVEIIIPVIWVIGSIIVSRILIDKKNIPIAYAVLFSAPVIAWLFLVRDTW